MGDPGVNRTDGEARRAFLDRYVSRRRLLLTGAAAGAMLGASSLLAACGDDDDDDGGGGGGSEPTATTATTATGQTPQATSQASGEPKAGGTLSMSLSDSDATNFDPIIPTDNMSIWTMLLFYDQVLRVGPDGQSIEPCLAEKWEASADGLSYTFHLRDAKFHDGSTVTADDIKYCLDRVVLDELSQWAWIFTAVDVYEVVDDKTIVGKLKNTWAPYLADLCLYSASIFPKAAHEAQAEAFFDNPIGSGPFKWVSWEKDVEIKLTKNPDFWTPGQPYLDDLTFKVLTDANNRMLQFQSGELDIATDAPFSQLDALRSDPNVQVVTDAVARFDYIAVNNGRFPDKSVRQAMNYAIDKDAIIKNVLFGAGEMANTMLPKMLYWAEDVAGYPYDLDKAKELMAASTMKDGFSGELIVSNGDPVGQQVCQLVVSNLKEIGGDITLVQAEPGSYRDKVRAFEYDMTKSYYTTDIIDPDELISFAVLSNGGTFAVWTQYKNEEVDRLGLEAAQTLDPEERKQLYQQIQQMSTDDAPVLFLYYPTGRTAVHNYIKNFKILPTGNYRLWEVWREE
jgi:peptide/nickel transport system substrate-binding protein